MKNIDDREGLENFKSHYGSKFVDLKNGKIGVRDDLSIEELKAHGLPDDWLNPPKQKAIEQEFRTVAISKKISPKLNSSDMDF